MSVLTDERRERTDGRPLLEISHLQTSFYTDKEVIRAVDDVSFDIHPGETVGIVGESGSGKSVTARSIMGLIESPGRIDGGAVKFRDLDTVRRFAKKYDKRTVDVTDEALAEAKGNDAETDADAFRSLVSKKDFVFVEERNGDEITAGYVDTTRAPDGAMRNVRGGGIAMVFQDPLTSLNPVYTVGNQIKESLRIHRGLSGQAATEKAIDLLEAVGIPDAARRVREYPHQFSGGMRQRAVIAMALACDPELLICDEPTTALDVTIQAQILELLDDIQEERDLGIMFITHDMGVIAEIADRVNVMYAGEIVETAGAVDLFENPRHPYTRGLLQSIPGTQGPDERLRTIEGDVPTPNEKPTYCRFAPRCPEAFDACDRVHPVPVAVNEDAADHAAACLLYPEDRSREDAVTLHDEQGKGETDAKTSGTTTGGATSDGTAADGGDTQ
ncbi:oligopeptide/dipeptide ABC transporter ATP-binding protein [Halobium salinum]|uniref:Nickel import system ATP-binding protein NikD n=1 Tax=Halobium salinum TaxID=1364940 RepID=A0ABD5PFZ8_9EURY|nr:oligopeptide/dipeptide ABC transporter ATP-binding protein [Halobium salinum]